MNRVGVASVKAMDELNRADIKDVDKRWDAFQIVEQIIPKSFTILPSNAAWKKRREAVMKTFRINYVSKLTPLFARQVQLKLDTMEKGKELDFVTEASDITSNIIMSICFGEDIFKGKYREEWLDLGRKIHFAQEENVKVYLHPVFFVSPALVDFLKLGPLKRREERNAEIYSQLASLLKKDRDDNCLYYKLMNEYGFTEEEALQDTAMVIIGGNDTSSRSIIAAIFWLKKNQKMANKLKEELAKVGITKDTDFTSDHFKENITECNYIDYVIKEVLRIDNAATGSMPKFASRDFKLCGVNIPKDCLVYYNFNYVHFSYEYWHEPHKFIPERFDPEDPLFFMPGKPTQTRPPLCYSPFSTGKRICPGQVLAKFEAKCVISMLVLLMDYDIPKEQLDRDDLKFCVVNFQKLKLTYNGRL
mmetsp:Transcript_10380/g.11836  ORF Transcript_10380/g.11836 Transcript_10380/m.11836 type:complete len:418 (+) Transcript_10380:312-1565(+)